MLAHNFGGATALRGYYFNGLRCRSVTIFDAVALAPWGPAFVQHARKRETASCTHDLRIVFSTILCPRVNS
jgi:hypothetical protein